jgi:fatty acid desaturase
MVDLQQRISSEHLINTDDYRIADTIALGCTCLTLIIYVGVCVLGFQLKSTAVLVLLPFPLAFVLQFFFNALHYCTHDTFVRSRNLNYILGTVFGCVTILNFSLYKPYHMQHHRYLFSNKDPEPTDRSVESKPQYLFEMLAPLFFIDNWLQSTKTMVRPGIPNIFKREPPYLTRSDKMIVAFNNCVLLVWMSFVVWLTTIVGTMMIWSYWAPLYISFVLANFVILPEHYQTDCVIGRNTVNSRTIKTGPLTRFFIVGLNYHAEHHLYPSVPFHNLPKLNRRIGQSVKHVDDSYLTFHWSLIKSLPWRARSATT